MRLLVSPMNAEEAKAALLGGADILDVKNTKEGSLGANFPWIIKEVVEIAAGEVPVSATIGDLQFKPGTASLAALGAAFSGAEYIKAGLLGIKTSQQAEEILRGIVRAVKDFDAEKKVVAAAYSDWHRAGSISPLLLPEAAKIAGADVIMVDTAVKDGRSTFEFMKEREIFDFVRSARELNLQVAIAGNISFQHLDQLTKVNPDIIGVRGVVCGGDRGDLIKANLVEKLKLAIS